MSHLPFRNPRLAVYVILEKVISIGSLIRFPLNTLPSPSAMDDQVIVFNDGCRFVSTGNTLVIGTTSFGNCCCLPGCWELSCNIVSMVAFRCFLTFEETENYRVVTGNVVQANIIYVYIHTPSVYLSVPATHVQWKPKTAGSNIYTLISTLARSMDCERGSHRANLLECVCVQKGTSVYIYIHIFGKQLLQMNSNRKHYTLLTSDACRRSMQDVCNDLIYVHSIFPFQIESKVLFI